MARPIDIDAIRAATSRPDAGWKAKEYPWIRGVPVDQLKGRLGLLLHEAELEELRSRPEPSVQQIVRQRRRSKPPFDWRGVLAGHQSREVGNPRPVQMDWRNRGGFSFITPVRDQMECGACVGFCFTALLESMVCVEHGLEANLSEADLFFCSGGGCGGWYPDDAQKAIQIRGVSLENCYPYQPQDQPCAVCTDRASKTAHAKNGVVFWNVESRKQYLADVGPMAAAMDVFEDFFAYRTGVYRHLTGDRVGGHCVEVIGYDDDRQSWICKNSWGGGWGEAGFFRIRYGECGIDADTNIFGLQFGSPFWGIHGIKLATGYTPRYFRGRFADTARDEILAHLGADSSWWRIGGVPVVQAQRVGNTAGFGRLNDGRPFWTGDFTGDGRTDVLFYYPGDSNWWLGQLAASQLQWSLVGNTFRRIAMR